MTVRREVVPPALVGERLDRAVSLVTGVSRAEAAELVDAGRVRLGGRAVTRRAERLVEGQELVVDHDEPVPPGLVPAPEVEVAVVWSDAHVLVVDKPAGLVVHPGAGHEGGTLAAGLLARFPELAGVGEPERPGVVHRLDRDTSGLLVVARTPEAHSALVAQLASREVEREYRALVGGHPEAGQGVVDAPIGRSPRQPTSMAVRADGRPARTHYEVLERFERPVATSLLACRLETGRTHQIRVHLAAIDHPVAGDDRYGGGVPALGCPRSFLHATRLAFAHPVTGAPVEVRSPLPPDLEAVLAGLRAATPPET